MSLWDGKHQHGDTRNGDVQNGPTGGAVVMLYPGWGQKGYRNGGNWPHYPLNEGVPSLTLGPCEGKGDREPRGDAGGAKGVGWGSAPRGFPLSWLGASPHFGTPVGGLSFRGSCADRHHNSPVPPLGRRHVPSPDWWVHFFFFFSNNSLNFFLLIFFFSCQKKKAA